MSDQPDAIAAAEQPAAGQSHEPIARGRFSLYQAPDEGFLCAVRVDGEEEDRHIHIPGRFIKMAGMLGGRSPLAAVRQMFGGGR